MIKLWRENGTVNFLLENGATLILDPHEITGVLVKDFKHSEPRSISVSVICGETEYCIEGGCSASRAIQLETDIIKCKQGAIGESSYQNIPTCDLLNELVKREGVTDWWAAPYMKYSVFIDDGHGTLEDTGPARILVVID